MKRYQKKFEESFIKVLEYKGHTVFDTKHSVEEFKNWFPTLSMEHYRNGLRRGINEILEKYKDTVGNYIFRSKKYGYGIQVEWRYDRNDTKERGPKHGYSATTLGKDETKFFTRKDITLFVEEIKAHGVINLKEDISFSPDIKEVAYFRLENNNEDMIGYDIFIENGEIFRTFDIIEIA